MENMFQKKYAKTGATCSFFTMREVGDKIQGTYIGPHAVEGDRFRGNCFNYEIMDFQGVNWLINGGNGGNRPLDKELQRLAPGMLVGVELVELRPTKMGNPAKIFEVYWNEDKWNDQWLAEHGMKRRTPSVAATETPDDDLPSRPSTPEELFPDNPVAETKAAPEVTKINVPTMPGVDEKVKQIFDIAKQKLGATDAEDAKKKIAEATGLAFLPINTDAILQKLQEI
ncbi:hypothetical protein [Candidatus Magnetobacterium casense]|uniref:Uncharacterized protein n=1 Tax=Candidatus Magnetobacterium casense TaxID=1455061 RepID=A0ABS6RU25_9BACT|nr:hypothetical protein [Candidatus Magnetobacterium casensis]MBV6340123.1 hypothetical protein [Candidatus Magnetobacterium casensis]